ncbi:MAG: hypothetical protein K8F52_12545 [Candidatus Scalindua rubra]|uniref:Uncharacterized protein n=1 Tax=Candidatus Scalindua brodae TaxID=237368 RepID=A0A0B0EDK5_9BACT|nr:MAG: hypothetical protein SCABRO_02982 [Candidatus Scalindua brodae]MBZ0109487.1 hypothetical protein [Candidatus Scalindua rubra]TWU36952.1 hypothetical protein S225a_04490 [Candidatus Brocadiaceae bacterium S225]
MRSQFIIHGIAIYGACELAEITYMVVSEMRWSFLGSFLGESKITDEKIPGCSVQSLDLLKYAMVQ